MLDVIAESGMALAGVSDLVLQESEQGAAAPAGIHAVGRFRQQVFDSLLDFREGAHAKVCNCERAIFPFEVRGSSGTILIEAHVH